MYLYRFDQDGETRGGHERPVELYNRSKWKSVLVTGVMQSEREIKSTSNLGRLKDGWREFDDAFKRFSEDSTGT